MSSKRHLLQQARRIGQTLRPNDANLPSKCTLCSHATPSRRPSPRRCDAIPRRSSSTDAKAANPRTELEAILLELQNEAPSLVNISRLQLALQGLRQRAGEETIRVAVAALEDGNGAGSTAKRLLRALLADPLKSTEDWERQLNEHDASKPLVLRLGAKQSQSVLLTAGHSHTLNELNIISAELKGLNLEVLYTPSKFPILPVGEPSIVNVEDAILDPVVEVPSHGDRPAPTVTPVHKALLVADGIAGAMKISALPEAVTEKESSIMAAANIDGLALAGCQLDTAFPVVDVALAERAIELFREGPQHAMEYERLWFASRIPELLSWLKSGASSSDKATKPAVKQLLASILQSTLSSIQAEEARKLSHALLLKNLPETAELNAALARWAQSAHAELQDELDLAFSGRRWRKLGWWKLFWRVDDVAMLTNEMLSQRFLPTAEQELVYLTGRIAGPKGQQLQYSQPTSSQDAGDTEPGARRLGSGELAPLVAANGLPKWPGHIAFTRRYLQNETIPALQALAQRLVAQALGTTGIASSLAALLYVSSFASTVYEAGAVAALGVVYSLARMQKKWETARGFWEGEVREEGRKAVRGAEESVAGVLAGKESDYHTRDTSRELEKAQELVAKAEDALARLQ